MKLFLTALAAFTSYASLINIHGVRAADEAPVCMAYKKPLAVNSDQVLHWKRTTKNQFQERGNVVGKVTQIFPDRSGHEHFEILIGRQPEDVIEVIYNSDFGKIPVVKVGDDVQACGDFIVATAQSGPYPPSPSGAIIHWIHKSPKIDRHPHGFLMINGVLYGQDLTNAILSTDPETTEDEVELESALVR